MTHSKCAPSTHRETLLAPAVDLYESAESFLIQADLPGVAQEHLKLRVEERDLVLEAKQDASLAEFGFGPVTFRRRFSLSREVDTEQIEARLENGLLRVKLGRLQAAKAREIPIHLA